MTQAPPGDSAQTGGSRKQAALTPVLVCTTMVVAVISSLGAPLIPRISTEMDVPLSTAQWSLTVALLVGAVSAPIMGRLGDGPRRREALIVGLLIVTLGGAIAALAPNLPLLLVGRALQGFGLALVPLTISAARDHLPRERVAATIGLLSVCASAGAGAGFPISGLLAGELGVSAAFWFGAVVSGLALLGVLVVVPSSSERSPVPLDITGALLLTAAVVPLLLAIAQGTSWGWSSIAVMGLFALAAVALAAWVRQQLRAQGPLVELRLLRYAPVLTGDCCAFILGVAMYINLSVVTEYVQTPREIGYGFSASVVVAGLCLVPFSVTSLAASRALPRLTKLVGSSGLLPLGSLIVAVAGGFFLLFHDSLWQAFVMMAFVGVGFGLTYAAIPGLIVPAVPEHETGSVMGFYQVVRYIGFSLGSAVTASILASHTAAGQHLPEEGGFTLALTIGVVVCVVAAVIAWTLPRRGGPSPAARLGRDDAEIASAGLTGLTRH